MLSGRSSVDFPAVFPGGRSLNRIQRRQFLIAAGALLAAPLAAEAQQTAKIARIGWLGDRPAAGPRLEAFFQGLRDLDYVEGRNLVIEYRYAEGQPERYPALAAERVALTSMS